MAQFVEGQSEKRRGCLFYGCMTCLAVVVVVVAALGALGYLGFRSQASAREVAAQFLDACEAEDYPGAYGLVSAAWRERLTAEGFAAAERSAAASRGSCGQRVTTGVSVQRRSGAPAHTEVAFDARCGGVASRIVVTAVKEQGQWRVDGVDYRSRRDLVPLACPNCSAPSPPGASFCPRCGHRLRPVEGPDPASE